MVPLTVSQLSSMPKPPRCPCVCCVYDARLREYHRRGGEGLLPDVPMYTARQILECPLFVERCNHADARGRYGEDDEARWFATHDPYVLSWLREAVDAGLEDPETALEGASTLLSAPTYRAWGQDPDDPELEPYSWEGITAWEVFFDTMAHGGLMEGTDARVVIDGIVGFADFLGRKGLIPSAIHERLTTEFEVWVPRIVDYFENDGPYYLPDGTAAK